MNAPTTLPLPLPIPTPLAKGEPGAGYPYSWSICPWLDGYSLPCEPEKPQAGTSAGSNRLPS